MAEEIYQQSLEIELGLRNILYQSKADIEVAYNEVDPKTWTGQ